MPESATSKPSKNVMTQVLVVLLIGAAFTIGLFWQKIQNLEKKETVAGVNSGVPAAQPPAAAPLVAMDCSGIPVSKTADGYVRGNANAPISWVEYSDLQCPYCQQIHASLCKIMKEYPGKVKWEYKHFPLSQIHPDAQNLALGAECAAQLGGGEKYWEYIDTVFTNTIRDSAIAAEKIGLNKGEFETCVKSDKIAQQVKSDYDAGVAKGVQGTPGNFVTGPDGKEQSIPGALPYESLKTTVEGML